MKTLLLWNDVLCPETVMVGLGHIAILPAKIGMQMHDENLLFY